MVVLQMTTFITIYVERLTHIIIIFRLQRYDKNLIRKIYFANSNNSRNFAVGFRSEITKRYASVLL